MLFLTAILLLVISILITYYFSWTKYKFSYWRRKNIAFIEPSIPFGSLLNILNMKQNLAQNLQDIYNHKNAIDQPAIGFYIFNEPALLIRDPELIKSVLVKNFYKFSNRYATTGKGDILGTKNLFFIKNPEWRELRSKFTPVFASKNIQKMFPLIQEVGNELDMYLESRKIDKDQSFVVEVKEMCALYTTDVIANVAFGMKANSLQNPEAECRRNVKIVFEFSYISAIQFAIAFFVPSLATFARSRIFPEKSENFLKGAISFVMDERIRNGTTRNDLIDVLIKFKKIAETETVSKTLPIDDNLLVAQALIFFSAGYESSASAMSFCLYELSKHSDIQTRLREEIRAVLQEGPLTYEVVNNLEYLTNVLMEVLRLYPSLAFLDRECTLSDSEKEFSLKPECDVDIPNNMPIYISLFGIQRDPKYFEDPEVFDPNRFSTENSKNIHPFTYMPFGVGPHNCVGERLAFLQMKLGLINILKNYYVTICDKSLSEIIFDPRAFIIQCNGGLYCKFVRDPLV